MSESQPTRKLSFLLNDYHNIPEANHLEQTLTENAKREARALRECRHKNIVRLLDCGADFENTGRQFYYLVLEYLPGGNLARLLQTRRLTLTETLELLGQISAALTCVHEHGLVHRDVARSGYGEADLRDQSGLKRYLVGPLWATPH